MSKKKVRAKYNAPGWGHKVGTVYNITATSVTIEFGTHDFIEVPKEDVIFMD